MVVVNVGRGVYNGDDGHGGDGSSNEAEQSHMYNVE